MNYFNTKNSLLAALCLSLVAGAAGCMAEQGDDVGNMSAMLPAGDSKPLVWTGWGSEEDPPLTCGTSRLVHGVDCDGDHCDNVRLDCVAVSGVSFGESSWSPWFSEEDDSDYDCSPGEWMTGLACDGSDCDNISLQCTEVLNKTATSCTWSGWYSEEEGPYQAGTNRYIRGVECRGSYCDDKRYHVCTLSNPPPK